MGQKRFECTGGGQFVRLRNRGFMRLMQASVFTAIAIAASCILTGACLASEEQVPLVKDVRFEPARPITGDKIKAYVQLENAVRAELRWSVNDGGERITDFDGVSPFVELDEPLKSGDTLKVSVTPFSGLAVAGRPFAKAVKCFNSPPLIKLANQTLKDFTYVAKIDAEDPEKGKVTLAVEGPEGMRIDQEGNITWKIKPGVEGNFPIKVTAKDEEGAEALLTYSVKISFPKK